MPVDGNAIGGLLIELYGSELTMATGVCGSCGNRAYLAEVVVYVGGPGAIARCRVCDAVLMAFVSIRGFTCVDGAGLASLEPPPV